MHVCTKSYLFCELNVDHQEILLDYITEKKINSAKLCYLLPPISLQMSANCVDCKLCHDITSGLCNLQSFGPDWFSWWLQCRLKHLKSHTGRF